MRERFGQPGRLNHRLDTEDRHRSAVQHHPVRTTLCDEEVTPSLLAHVHLQRGMVTTLTTFRLGAGEAAMPTPITRALIGRRAGFAAAAAGFTP